MTAGRGCVAVFCMQSPSHFVGLRPIISALSARRVETYVFTHRDFRTLVERDGGTFVDLFAQHTLEEADSESIPSPCRSVSFAGLYAEAVAREVERIGPSLIVYDEFALVGYVVARALAIPYVKVCAGHNLSPANYREVLSTLPAPKISARCEEAVRRLRDLHGLEDASPFSFASTSSPFLNIYLEPPEFLSGEERKAFEPVAFFGALPSDERVGEHGGARVASFAGAAGRELRVYVAFGGVVWKHFPQEALAAVRSIAAALGQMEGVRAVISLGGYASRDTTGIGLPNVTVERYVDQWCILADADLFVTHHGRKSTHEAIFHRVPMISQPFFGDQIGLAKRCQELGLAIPLTRALRAEPRQADVRRGLETFHENRDSLRERLEIARGWETSVIERRGEVVDRLMAMI